MVKVSACRNLRRNLCRLLPALLLAASLPALAAAPGENAHAASPAQGLQVSLRNGFELVCARMESANGKTRLYLHADTADYVDIQPADILAIEKVDLPTAPQPVALASSTGTASGKQLANSSAPVDLPGLSSSAGARHDLDPDLIASVIHAESGGNPHAVSRTGARGLMQLMPGTAAQAGVSNSFDAAQNVEGGTAYLNALLLYYHDNLALALAAYNAGPGAVQKYHGIPPYAETRAYVARVIHDFNRRKTMAAAALRQQARKQRAEFATIASR
jgi:soluble lytic murein transglycosylase-like protein